MIELSDEIRSIGGGRIEDHLSLLVEFNSSMYTVLVFVSNSFFS